MKYIIYLFLLVSPILFAQKTESSTIKHWSETNSLVVADFKSDSIIDVNIARTVVMLDYFSNSKGKFIVRSLFNHSMSYFPKIKSYGNLLKHEQGHFDIIEIFARKLRKKLFMHYQLNDKLSNKSFYKIYNSVISEYRLFNKAYDKETNHALNITIQKKWDDKINNTLISLQEYSFTNYSIKLNQLE